MALENGLVRPSATRAVAAILGPDRPPAPAVEGEDHGELPTLRNPAIYMASEEFQLLDCEFCDDVIDVSGQELPELEPAPA